VLLTPKQVPSIEGKTLQIVLTRTNNPIDDSSFKNFVKQKSKESQDREEKKENAPMRLWTTLGPDELNYASALARHKNAMMPKSVQPSSIAQSRPLSSTLVSSKVFLARKQRSLSLNLL